MTASKVLKFVLPQIILVLGVGAAKGLMSFKTKAERKAPEALISAVEYITVSSGSPAAKVQAAGTVEGDKQVSLSSLVSGEVVSTSPDLVPGGRFRAGQTLLRVDPRDYEVAVSQERSRVQQAQVELSMEEQRGQTAAREWELLGGGKDASSAPLALRGPQMETARAALAAAQSGLQRAQLNLERTTLQAPFNAMVLMENVEVGQLLAPGAAIVTVVGTDRFRVKVAVPVQQLRHVAIPGIDGSVGSDVRLIQDLGDGAPIERQGQVMRLAGQLDAQTRTAELYVAIEDPLSGEGLPMLPGAFVTVLIEGKEVPGAIAVPREAIVDGAGVWTVDAEDRLTQRAVSIGWQDGDTAFVLTGLEEGDRVVVTPPSLAVEGATVRPLPRGEAAAEAPADTATEG